MLCTPNSVFVHQGKVWLYYRGSIGTLATGRVITEAGREQPELKQLGEAWRLKAGLARLREDGFAYLTLKSMQRISGTGDFNEVPKYHMPTSGRVATIPIDASGIESRALHVNVGNMAPGFAWLKVQLRDADTGQVLAGYGWDDCDALGDASLDQTITWKGSADLSRVAAKRIRVEFRFFGNLDSPQLYSFWFAPKQA
jgi:hypothetical protein